jgi:hypothetical protein
VIRRRPRSRTLRFRKVIDAPLPFVFEWCTDFRDDDDRLTDDLYRYRARILLRQPGRVIREIVVPGPDRNRATEVELIDVSPPDRWRSRMFSASLDRVGSYRLLRVSPYCMRIEMRFRESWRSSRPSSRLRYRALFDEVWDRYAERIEREFRALP